MVFIGVVVVFAAVLIGFSMAGGHVSHLVHPSEIVTIGGASLGALLVMSPKKVITDLMRGLVQVLKGSPYNKAMYADLFKVLYALSRLARREGLVALDGHLESPDQSNIFQQCPRVTKNHHARDFLCQGLALIVDGKVEAGQLHTGFEEEIKVIEREHHAAVSALSKTADALPGFGIVAAVLGIVVTMQAIGGPVDEIGHKVGAALVGTFLGILLSYGLFAPLAGRMEFLGESELTFFRTIASAVIAMAEGVNPKEVVLRARRSVGTDARPNKDEMETIFKEGEIG